MPAPPFAPTSRIFEGFETIAHQRLRPNERPKIPIAAIMTTRKYGRSKALRGLVRVVKILNVKLKFCD